MSAGKRGKFVGFADEEAPDFFIRKAGRQERQEQIWFLTGATQIHWSALNLNQNVCSCFSCLPAFLIKNPIRIPRWSKRTISGIRFGACLPHGAALPHGMRLAKRLRVVFILPGRHQPPHNDHLEIIRRALARIDGTLYLALIVSPPPQAPAETELEREARRQNDPDRTLFTFTERVEMMEAALDRESRARIRIIALPRPESAFDVIAAVFPERRTWIVPDTKEAFDEMKARFFRERGDEIMRIELAPTTNGRVVRSLIRRGELRLLEHHVPSGVVNWLKRRSTCRELES